jgi:HK97 gp10 family phage protein
MAGNFTFNVVGLDALIARLQNAPQQIVKEVSGELLDAANRIAGNAIRQAPVDEGGLRRGITVKKVSATEYAVVSAARYSPFIEWGTKKQVSVPSSLKAYAATFKGIKGGTKEQFLKAITGWVRRKGIRFDGSQSFKSGKKKGQKKKLTIAQTALLVYYSILSKGIKPQPFFFDNLAKESPLLIKRVEAVLNRIV